MAHRVEIVTTPPTTIAARHFEVANDEMSTIGEQMGSTLAAVVVALSDAHIPANGPAIACYRPTGDGFEVSAGFAVPEASTLPAGLDRLHLGAVEAAHTTHVGPYTDLPSAYADVLDRIAAAGRTVAADEPMWEEYWTGPSTPASQHRTEIFWPVR